MLKKYIYKKMLGVFLAFCCVGAAFAASNEKELFVVAQRAFEDGFYDVSVRYVNQLLQEFPNTDKYVEARLLEGQCYFFKKQYLKAFNVFKDLADKETYKDASLFWLGESYLKAGDHAKAREQYERVIEGFPNSLYAPQSYYSLGWTYFEKGAYADARKVFQRLVEKFPSNNLAEDASFKLGECEYNAGQYEGAVFQFNGYLKTYPNTARQYEALFNIAEAYYYLEQYQFASDFYQKAKDVTHIPRNQMAALLGQGWSAIKLGKYDDALRMFEDAQAVAKTNAFSDEDVLIGKASLFTAQEKYVNAVASYSALIARFADSERVPESYLGRANAYYLQNDFPAAISDYKKLIDSYGSKQNFQKVVEKARFGLAWTYLKSGDLEKSIASFQEVIDKTGSKSVKVSALTQIGDAYQEAGRIDDAVAAYDKILKEMPDTPYSDYAQYRLGVALLKAERNDAAVLAFQSLKSNYPKSKYALEVTYYLGVAYFKKKDWASAVDVLEAFLKDNQTRTEFVGEARYILGLSYFNLKQYSKATAVFQDIIKIHAARQDLVRNAEVGLAKTAYESGNVKDALAQFKAISFRYARTEAHEESLLWMGQHYMSQGLYGKAVELYEESLTVFSSSQKSNLAHFELGRAYHVMGQFDKALEQYRLVNPKADADLYAKARLAVADIFSRELDPEKAVETYQNIIATSPEFRRDALMKIAQICRRAKKYQEELDTYTRALQADKSASQTSSAEIQFQIGDAYEVIGDADKAIEAYFKIPYLYEKEKFFVVKAYLRIAKLYENKEDIEKALTAYQKIADMKVDESKFAEERIAAIKGHK